MLQMKERAKFMPENKVFGQAGGAESISTMKNMDYSLYFVFDCQEKKDEGSTNII